MKWIALVCLSLLLALGAALALSVDTEPKLRQRVEMTPERIARGKQIFEQNDPRRLKAGAVSRVNLSEQDLNLAVNYIANQTLGGLAGVGLEQGRALIDATLDLPANPLGGFLNIELELLQGEQWPRIGYLQLGKIKLPGALAETLLDKGMQAFLPLNDWRALSDTLTQVRFEPRRMTASYRWQHDLPAKLTALLWSETDKKRLLAYQTRLLQLTQTGQSDLELRALLSSLFGLAAERSNGGDAVAENRALLLVLAFYVNQKDLGKLIAATENWPHPVERSVVLNGRNDFSQHYLVSAMLAAYAKTAVADAVGLYKEIQDSRGGSGFSFNDIAADRAGTRLGELATGSASQARSIQSLMASAKESDFMPITADLPEFMPEAEFKRRFGGLQGEKYRQMMAEIERRITALPVNR